MPYFANVVDLAEIDAVGRMIVGGWIDRHDIRALDPDRIDADYVRITADDGEQADARADILRDKFGVRVEERAA